MLINFLKSSSPMQDSGFFHVCFNLNKYSISRWAASLGHHCISLQAEVLAYWHINPHLILVPLAARRINGRKGVLCNKKYLLSFQGGSSGGWSLENNSQTTEWTWPVTEQAYPPSNISMLITALWTAIFWVLETSGNLYLCIFSQVASSILLGTIMGLSTSATTWMGVQLYSGQLIQHIIALDFRQNCRHSSPNSGTSSSQKIIHLSIIQ